MSAPGEPLILEPETTTAPFDHTATAQPTTDAALPTNSAYLPISDPFDSVMPVAEEPQQDAVVYARRSVSVPETDSKYNLYDTQLEKGKCAVVADAKYVRPFSEIGRLVQTDKAHVVGEAKYVREAELRGTAAVKQDFQRAGEDLFQQHVREWGSVYTSHEVKPHQLAIGGRVEKFGGKAIVDAGKDVFIKASAPKFQPMEQKQYGKAVSDYKTVTTSEKHYDADAIKKFISNVHVAYDKVIKAPLQKIPVAYEGRTICPENVPDEFRGFLRVTTDFDVKQTRPINAGPYKAVVSRQDYTFDYDLNLVKGFTQEMVKSGTVGFTQRGANVGTGTYARDETHEHRGIYYIPGKELGSVRVFECAVPSGRTADKAVAKPLHVGQEVAKGPYAVTGVMAQEVRDVGSPVKWAKVSGSERTDVAHGAKAAQKLGVVPGEASIYDPREHGALAPAPGHAALGIATAAPTIFPPTCGHAGEIVRGCSIAGLGNPPPSLDSASSPAEPVVVSEGTYFDGAVGAAPDFDFELAGGYEAAPDYGAPAYGAAPDSQLVTEGDLAAYGAAAPAEPAVAVAGEPPIVGSSPDAVVSFEAATEEPALPVANLDAEPQAASEALEGAYAPDDEPALPLVEALAAGEEAAAAESAAAECAEELEEMYASLEEASALAAASSLAEAADLEAAALA